MPETMAFARIVFIVTLAHELPPALGFFNRAFTDSMHDKIAAAVAVPWAPLGSVATGFASGSLDWRNDNESIKFLWNLMKPFTESSGIQPVDAIYAGFENAKMMMYSRESPPINNMDLTLYVASESNSTCPSTDSPCLKSWPGATDPRDGSPIGSYRASASYDCRGRPWYTRSKGMPITGFGTQSGATWSEIYTFLQGGYSKVGITAARHVLSADGSFLGVAGVDFFLDSIEEILKSSTKTSKGTLIVFVVDDDGKMISSSVDDTVTRINLNGVEEQQNARNNTNAVIGAVANSVMSEFGGWDAASGLVKIVDVAPIGLHYYQSLNLTDDYGLHWHVAVVEVVQCDKGYYVAPTWAVDRPAAGTTECLVCPVEMECYGGTAMPYPKKGYWVNRDAYEYGGTALRCARQTCAGFRERVATFKGVTFNFGSVADGSDDTVHSNVAGFNDDQEYEGISNDVMRCWNRAYFNQEDTYSNSTCDPHELMCSAGSSGPLCGSCTEGFTFSATTLTCVSCERSSSWMPAFILALLIVVGACVRAVLLKSRKSTKTDPLRKKLEKATQKWKLSNPLRHFDRGMVKVCWSTYQILSTVSWNLGVTFPEPFTSVTRFITHFNLDITTSLSCSFKGRGIGYKTRILLSSIMPLSILALNFMIYLGRVMRRLLREKSASRWRLLLSAASVDDDPLVAAAVERLGQQHMFFFLAFTYLILPTVAMLQFGALDCVDLAESSIALSRGRAEESALEDVYEGYNFHVLRLDTAVDCDPANEKYKSFYIANVIFILIFQSVPLVWLTLLWQHRKTFDPLSYEVFEDDEAEKGEIALRKSSARSDSRSTSRAASRSKPYFLRGASQSKSSTGALFQNSLERALSRAERAAAIESVVADRERNSDIRYLAFLWQDYKPSAWWYEVVEIYRREIFAAVLPVIATAGLPRIAVGCGLAVLAVAIVREASPFLRDSTNVLLNLGQYQVLLTFISAFVVAADAFNVNDPESPAAARIGWLLLIINCSIIGVAAAVLFVRFRIENMQQSWRRNLAPVEIGVIHEVMGAKLGGVGEVGSGEANGPGNRRMSAMAIELVQAVGNSVKKRSSMSTAEDLLHRHLLRPTDVELVERVGAGSFGEFFRGRCLGQTVAVKSMLEVTNSSMKAFRSEILLTAQLRHPNIVNFVGACWGEDLTCLVLEWVGKGSLTQVIRIPTMDLRWGEPLLRIAADVARGMVYLHQREFFDEETGTKMRCVMHRDLKTENILMTNFLRAKISDFGTSRARSFDQLQQTSVGTPLFGAPEIHRGEAYDESCDVYSFGMLLLDLAVEDDIVTYLRECWSATKGKKAPKNPMRIVWAITEEQWRPFALGVADEGSEQPSSSVRLDAAPPLVAALVLRCLDHDPKARPSFAEILFELEGGPIAREVAEGDFGRQPKSDRSRALTAAEDSVSLRMSAINSALGAATASGSQDHGPGESSGSQREADEAAREEHRLRASRIYNRAPSIVGGSGAPDPGRRQSQGASSAPPPVLPSELPVPPSPQTTSHVQEGTVKSEFSEF